MQRQQKGSTYCSSQSADKMRTVGKSRRFTPTAHKPAAGFRMPSDRLHDYKKGLMPYCTLESCEFRPIFFLSSYPWAGKYLAAKKRYECGRTIGSHPTTRPHYTQEGWHNAQPQGTLELYQNSKVSVLSAYNMKQKGCARAGICDYNGAYWVKSSHAADY